MTKKAPAPKDPHDREFFEQMRGCRDNYRKLGDAIHAILRRPYEAYDIGCGIGLQTARLQELGWSVSGLEFAPAAIDLIEPGVTVESFDLTKAQGGRKGVTRPARTECVICTETAEHIPAKFADRIVENVAALATDVIVWSAAAPGQEWHGHINLQRPEYWLGRFAEHGWVLDVARTGALRDEMQRTEAQHFLGKENFCILVPKEKYKPLHFTITSTVFNAQQYIERHIQSVARQTYPHYKHVIVDAASTDLTHAFAKSAQAVIDAYGEKAPVSAKKNRVVTQNPKGARKGPLENAYNIWRTLPDDEVIVWLDGDDWLAVDNALDIVARTYASPIDPWTTYGQFMFASGELGFAGPYQPGQNARDSDWWRATHLKTFRAGLVKSIDPQLFKDPSGEFCSLAIDRAVMYPLLELAGEHQAFIDKILYVYNSKASWWANQPASERERELAEVVRMRALPRLSPLTKAPW
jgi:SAM-dependent methyltransferase